MEQVIPWIVSALVIGLGLWLRQRRPARGSAPATVPAPRISPEVDAAYPAADALVREYARVADDDDYRYLKPQSQLPASREEIRNALLTVAVVGRAGNSFDDEDLDVYRKAYGATAEFVDDALANRLRDGMRTLREASGGNPHFDAVGELFASVMDQESQGKLFDERQHLMVEFDRRFAEMCNAM